MKSSRIIWVVSKSNNKCLIRREDVHRNPGKKDGGRDLCDVSTSQGMARFAGCHQKLTERHRAISLSEPLGTNPISSLIGDSSLQNSDISIALSCPVCGNLLQQPKDTNIPHYEELGNDLD